MGPSIRAQSMSRHRRSDPDRRPPSYRACGRRVRRAPVEGDVCRCLPFDFTRRAALARVAVAALAAIAARTRSAAARPRRRRRPGRRRPAARELRRADRGLGRAARCPARSLRRSPRSGRAARRVSVRIDYVMLGPNSGGVGPAGSSPDQMIGEVTGGGVTQPAARDDLLLSVAVGRGDDRAVELSTGSAALSRPSPTGSARGLLSAALSRRRRSRPPRRPRRPPRRPAPCRPPRPSPGSPARCRTGG